MLTNLLKRFIMAQTREDAARLFEAAHAQYDVVRRQQVPFGRATSEQQTATEQYNDALEDFKQARAIYQQISDWYGEARTLFHIGLVYEGLENAEEILHAYEDALATLGKHQIKDDASYLLMAKIYNNLGVFHSNRAKNTTGDARKEAIEKGIDCYKRARSSLEEIHLQKQPEVCLEWGKVFNNLGQIYQVANQWLKSLECYKEALLYYQDIADNIDVIIPESIVFYNIVDLLEFTLNAFRKKIYPQGGSRHHPNLESQTIQSIIGLAEHLLLRSDRLRDDGKENIGGGGFSSSGCHSSGRGPRR